MSPSSPVGKEPMGVALEGPETQTRTVPVSQESSASKNSSPARLDTMGMAEETEEETEKVGEALAKAKALFTRKNGVVYVKDNAFTRMTKWARHCHIYVSGNEENAVEGRKTTPDSATAKASAPEESSLSDSMPIRMTVVNQLVARDLANICTTTRIPFNYHLAPFRGLVPHEEDIKKRFEKLKTDFDALAAKHPNHAAVLRKEDYLHPKLAFNVYNFDVSSTPAVDDPVNEARMFLDGYRALVHFLDADLRHLLDSCRRIRDRSVAQLPFSHLTYLFALHPTTPVISGNQAYLVTVVEGGRATVVNSAVADKKINPSGDAITRWTTNYLTIHCFNLGFDGVRFGPTASRIEIRPYDGLRKITDLPAYPICFAASAISGPTTLSDALHQRGLRFKEMTKVGHWRYKGPALREPDRLDVREEIDSDIMIDLPLAYRIESEIEKPEFDDTSLTEPERENPQKGMGADNCKYSFEEGIEFANIWRESIDPRMLEPQEPDSMLEESYLLLPAKTYGYVFLRRKWYLLDVDLITEVPPVTPGKNDGFEKLVLPRGHKDIVRALVKMHSQKVGADGHIPTCAPQRDFDLVNGKSRGFILLLHGAPGVGKTSTAECVAVNAGRPLFHISCGDLGSDSVQEVKKNLDQFFDMASRWNCVFLLDEADVFLSSRQMGNIKQNSLVSVFLRVLEYYPGILILTTNRVGNFDEAIKSRVHCALYYPPLDEENTYKVWKRNIEILEERNKDADEESRVHFDRRELRKYAREHWETCEPHQRWNGRQIKNAFQTAVALAEWRRLEKADKTGQPKGPVLTRRDFEQVAEANKHFDNYIKNLRSDYESRARESGLRDDRFTVQYHGIGDRRKAKSGKAKPTSRKRDVLKKKRRQVVSETEEEDTEDVEEDESSEDEEEEEEDDSSSIDGDEEDESSEGEEEDEETDESSESELEVLAKHSKKGRTASAKAKKPKSNGRLKDEEAMEPAKTSKKSTTGGTKKRVRRTG